MSCGGSSSADVPFRRRHIDDPRTTGMPLKKGLPADAPGSVSVMPTGNHDCCVEEAGGRWHNAIQHPRLRSGYFRIGDIN